jgi:RNA polymerase sigma factor (sigma-70 family)
MDNDTYFPESIDATNHDLPALAGDRDNHIGLVERARAKDPEAMRELIILFRPLVERVARRRCSRRADVEDVMQEVWVALLAGINTIHSPACLPGWLYRVAVNAATQHGRKTNRAIPLAELPEARRPPDDENVALGTLIAESTRHDVHGALGRLKASDRHLMELLMAEDRPDYAVVSKTINRPMGSIGPTRRRVLHRLSADPAIVRLAAGERSWCPAR